MTVFKRPESVLVVVYSQNRQVLLLERADYPDNWQSVTGSLEHGELPIQAAWRELYEETGLTAAEGKLTDWQQQNIYEIYPRWRWRYPPDVTHNREYVFGFCVPQPCAVRLAQNEHLTWRWCSALEAADIVFSESNAAACRSVSELEGDAPLHGGATDES